MKKINEEEDKLAKEKLFQQMEAYQAAIAGIETPEETIALNRIAEEEAAEAKAKAERRANLTEAEQKALEAWEASIAKQDAQDTEEKPKVVPFRKKKKSVYVLIAAVVILSLAIGTTGIGMKYKWLQVGTKEVSDMNITTVESDEDIISLEELEEAAAFANIEKVLGMPVIELISDNKKFEYLEAEIVIDSTKAEILYDYEGVILVYNIILNHTGISYQEIIEDTIVDEYVITNGEVEIEVVRYIETESGLENMMATYTINNVFYSISGRVDEVEFQEILENLYFY